MIQSIDIRPYQSGDEDAILELFRFAFGRRLSAEYWRWRFLDNPASCTIIDLAWDGNRLASHYAVSPTILYVEGHSLPAALSMTTMTHPDYRGRGLFTALAQNTYQRMSASGMGAVYGFPNEASHHTFARDLGWTDIHEIPTLRRALAEGEALPKPAPQVRELAGIDDRFDKLWATVKDNHRILVQRDATYLAWRYLAHPSHRYVLLGYLENDTLQGYAICKPYQNDFDVVDILSVDDAVGLQLIVAAASLAERRMARAINVWMNSSLRLHHRLEKIGFRDAEPVTYFGARVLEPGARHSDPYNFRNWYVTMGDSDVY